MMELFDTHCHLEYDYSPKSEVDLIREAELAGVKYLVTIGTEIKSLPRVVEISQNNPNVFHSVGIHPHEAITFKDEDLILLRSAAQHPKCRAIGEIGLDYHYDHSPPDVQKRVLKTQLDLAIEVSLPIIIHSREAEPDLLAALREYASRVRSGKVPGVIHCFTGTQEFGQACLDLGFLISFSGIITFKNAEDLRKAAYAFPLEKMLIETDSPYLAPVPHRGKKCEPSMVQWTAQKIAEIKKISVQEVAQITTANAKNLFGIN